MVTRFKFVSDITLITMFFENLSWTIFIKPEQLIEFNCNAKYSK